MIEKDNIYNMDCLKGMRKMETESIDLTVTSPPYDNMRTYNGYCFDFENIARELYRVTKQEWSEEDEQHIDSLLKRLDALCRNKFERTRFAISEDRDWLKSLRPQNRWKPSDNELEVLRLVAEKDGTCLMGLYEQLKKLKEGKV